MKSPSLTFLISNLIKKTKTLTFNLIPNNQEIASEHRPNPKTRESPSTIFLVLIGTLVKSSQRKTAQQDFTLTQTLCAIPPYNYIKETFFFWIG